MVQLCENRMLIFAFYEKRLPISSTKDSTTAQGVKINWFEKFEMLRLLSLTKSILLCADLTRTMVFNLPKPMFAKLCFCFWNIGYLHNMQMIDFKIDIFR